MNWIRYFKLTVEGGGKSLDLSNMRVRFQIKQWTSETPNLADIRVTNLSPETMKPFIQQEYKIVTIEAGYKDTHGILFKGDIVQARIGRENPTDKYLDIFARDGEHWHNFAVVNKTFAAGSTPKDHYDEAMKAFKGLGAKAGFLDPEIDLSKPKYPRAVTLYGMARNVMRNIAHSKEATWSTQNGEVQLVGLKNGLPDGAIELNSTTGLIGLPTQEIGGIMARVLINPNIKVHSLIHINQSSIQAAQLYRSVDGGVDNPQNALLPEVAADGIYKVLQINVDGDTRGNPWYQDLACIAKDSSILPSNLKIYEGTE
jgi:hypothetical protein